MGNVRDTLQQADLSKRTKGTSWWTVLTEGITAQKRDPPGRTGGSWEKMGPGQT